MNRAALLALMMVAGCATWRDGVRSSGTLVRATLVSAVETGWYINGRPQVDLHLRPSNAAGAPSELVVRELVPLTQLYLLAPGTELWVRFDPQRPQHAVLAAEDSSAELRRQIEEQQAIHRTLATSGQAAPARITRVVSLGAHVNGDNPFLAFDVDVLPDGMPPFSAQVRGVIAAASVGKFVVGASVFVFFDPLDHRRVALKGSER